MPIDDDRLRDSLYAPSAYERTGGEPRDVLEGLIEEAPTILDVSGVALMLADDQGRLRCVATTSEAARALERAQLQTDEGPCLECARTDGVVAVSDMHYDDRWPALRGALGGALAGFIAVPVHLGGETVGSLNAFSDERIGWSRNHERLLCAYARLIERCLPLLLPE